MKTCSKCKITQPKTNFSKVHNTKDGLNSQCKLCRKAYNRTPEAKAKNIYATQCKASKRRGNNPPKYTREDFTSWLLKQTQYQKLYSNWKESNYNSDLAPSCDRLDDYKGYSFDNIQIITWKENNDKANKDAYSGKLAKTLRAVNQYTLDGVYVRTFHSVSAAARHFNGIPTNIIGAITQRTYTRKNTNGTTRVCKVKTAYGFNWKYAN